MKTKALLSLFIGVAAIAAGATQPVSEVVFLTNESRARISYRLVEDAIVTAEIRTNGIPVAAADFATATGDVNRLVPAGVRTIVWPLPEGWSYKTLRKAEAVVTTWPKEAPPKYLVVDLVASNTAYYCSAEALPAGGLTNDLYRTSKIVFVRIPAANRPFVMGRSKAVRTVEVETGHEVTLTQDYWMSVFEITQRQYAYVMGENPSAWTEGEDAPLRPFDRATFARIRGNGDWPKVRTVSEDSFCGRLRRMTGIDTVDLPTDAQWEFACKADGSMEAPNGAVHDSNGSYLFGKIDCFAWYGRNSAIDGGRRPHRVGEKQPNGFGLYDMLGNVWEWVLDYLNSNDVEAVIDPIGAEKGNDGKRLLRGGSYTDNMDKARASFRSMAYYPSLAFSDDGYYGFRPVCTFRPPAEIAVPEGTGVRWTRDPASGFVTVAYDLDREAIVTADIRTNGVSIGGRNLWQLSGDVNRLVSPGAGRVFRWLPPREVVDWSAAAGTLSVVITAWNPAGPPDYLAVDLIASGRQLYYASAEEIPGGIHHERYKTGMLLMRRIPAAGVTFRMGSVAGETGREPAKEIPRYVTLTNDFYMAVFETTVMQHYNITGGFSTSYCNPDVYTNCMISAINLDLVSPSGIRGAGAGASWPQNHDVDEKSVIGRLRDLVQDVRFDLPTEAQWELAFRAGSPEKHGADNVVLDDVAWTFSNTPAPVSGYWHLCCVGGLKQPNGFGLYDMLGNAGEMCLDWYAEGDAYSVGEETVDPRGPSRPADDLIVCRGGDIRSGDYRYPLARCRAAARGNVKFTASAAQGIGYRVLRFIGFLPGPFELPQQTSE